MARHGSLVSTLVGAAFCLVMINTTPAQPPQSQPLKSEFNVGFSYLTDFNFGGSGFTVGYAEKATPWFQVEVQLDANFNLGPTTFDQYTTTGGPKFSLPGKRLTPYVHMLLGASHFRAFNRTGTEFAVKYGGGLDVTLTRNWAARFELNDLVIWNPITHNLQVNTGLVVRF